MNLVLRSYEEVEASLAHGAILCTKEQLDDYYLMHFKTKGAKNGVRRYQDENGKLTPEGYRHYAEMYGWGRKLNKAEKLQNKADKLSDKARSSAERRDELSLESYRARKKNERNPSERRAVKAARLNERSEAANMKALNIDLKARKAQDRASSYADKLQRKDDRVMAKIDKKLDEAQLENAKNFASELAKQNIADKAIMNTVADMNAKRTKINQDSDLAVRDSITGLGRIVKEDLDNHSYITSVDLGKGREAYVEIKRNGKDVDITSYAKEGLIKQNLAEKAIEKVETALKDSDANHAAREVLNKRMNSYDSLPEDSPDRKASLDQVHRYLEDMKSGQLKVNPQAQKDLNAWYDQKIADEKRLVRQLVEHLPEYDNLSEKDKARAGNWVLEELAATSIRDYRKNDETYEKLSNDLQDWLVDQVYEKAGSMNASDYKPGTNALRAQEKADMTWTKMDERESQIKKENGIPDRYSGNAKQDKRDAERLQKLLQKDSTWKKLDVQLNKDYDEVNGAILKDLGFPDTSRNRSILYQFGWWD